MAPNKRNNSNENNRTNNDAIQSGRETDKDRQNKDRQTKDRQNKDLSDLKDLLENDHSENDHSENDHPGDDPVNDDRTARGTLRKTPAERAMINALNAVRSTGPRTEAGKARSSMNALRHGLSTPINYYHPGDFEAFQQNRKLQVLTFRPVTLEETVLVEKLANVEWKIKSCDARENNAIFFSAIALKSEPGHSDHFSLSGLEIQFSDYHRNVDPQSAHRASQTLEWLDRQRARLDRQYHKLRAEIKLLRRERLMAKRAGISDLEDDDFDEDTSPALEAIDSETVSFTPGTDIRESAKSVLIRASALANPKPATDKPNDAPTQPAPEPEPDPRYPKMVEPPGTNYGFPVEEPMFQGFAHDWAGWVNDERNWFSTFRMPRYREDGRERWPYNPDGSPREFYGGEDGQQDVCGPRPESGMPERIPPSPDWGKPRPPKSERMCIRCKKEPIVKMGNGKPLYPRAKP